MNAARDGVLCVGRLYCDLVFTGLPRLPTLGTEVFAEGLSLHPGGGAAITAAYLAAQGRPSHLGAHLPAAPFDAPVARVLDALSVRTGFCRPAPEGADPQITVAMAATGDRAFLTRDAGSAAPALDVAAIRAAGIGHLHVGELKTLAERPDLLDVAQAAGLTVSLDCGWDDGLTATAAALIARVDVFLPSEEEHARLSALGVPARGRVLTAVKRGAAGARVLTEAGSIERAAEPATVIDTTGAGDAFNGGFLHVWLAGGDAAACLARGVACGARAVAAAGGVAGAASMGGGHLAAAG